MRRAAGIKLNRFATFEKNMLELPQFSALQRSVRTVALRKLYEFAERKAGFESGAALARDQVSALRKERNELERDRKLLQKGATVLEEVWRTLEKYDGWLPGPAPEVKLAKRGFRKKAALSRNLAIQEIRTCLEMILREMEFNNLLAASVHPSLRNKEERRLAREFFNYFKFFPEGEPKAYLIGAKTPAIAHWFIGEAASNLKELRKDDGSIIGNLALIIAKLFKAAFNEIRTEESIRKELSRQNHNGRPDYRGLLVIANPARVRPKNQPESIRVSNRVESIQSTKKSAPQNRER